jgi:phenylacetate-CoA ligase
MRINDIFSLYILQRNQWKSPSEIRAIQNRKLKRLIRHAYQKVPYYKELFDSVNINPEDVRDVEDLKNIPATSRQTLSNLKIEEITAHGIDLGQCRASATSGTTGIPLRIYGTPHDSTMMNLGWARAFLSCGMKPWDKSIAFIGHNRAKSHKSWYEHFGLWRRKEISARNLPDDWVAACREWKPQVIMGYVMTLRLFAEIIQERQIKDIKPEHIFHSSGIIDPNSRDFLESAFQAHVVDFYGSDEAGCIAWECGECSAYHVAADMTIVEVLKTGQPAAAGEEGEIVITNLHSYAMPFIRYKQEDVVLLSDREIACGRSFPLLQTIQGRVDDYVTLRSGRRISPHPFYHCLDPVPGIRKWQIIQKSLDEIQALVEAGPDFSEDSQRSIRMNLLDLVQNELELKISVVNSMAIDPSRKFRSVCSNVHRGF